MNIGIYIYDEAEVLDFSGPFEVFSTAKRLQTDSWRVFLISECLEPVRARGGYFVIPHYSIEEHPKLDVLVVVGGVYTKELSKHNVIEWIKQTSSQATRVASVCTGAFLLAKADLLHGLRVTTHWEDIPELKQSFPQLNVVEDVRWVSDEKYVTSGGISAGIDMSLYLVSELHGTELATLVAKQMEYRWQSHVCSYFSC